MSKLIPLHDHVLVEPIQEDDTTKSGIILPTSKDDKPSKGTVIAVGPWRILEDDGDRAPMDVSEGDIVYFTKYSPDEIEVDGHKYLIIKQSSILAKQW